MDLYDMQSEVGCSSDVFLQWRVKSKLVAVMSHTVFDGAQAVEVKVVVQNFTDSLQRPEEEKKQHSVRLLLPHRLFTSVQSDYTECLFLKIPFHLFCKIAHCYCCNVVSFSLWLFPVLLATDFQTVSYK